MHTKYESFVREPLVDGHKTYHDVTEDIISPIEKKPGRMWYVGFFFSVALLLFGVFSVFWEVYFGIGVWGINRTVGWGWDITNFVWWVGIGHAGTLISAILLLFRQGWRTGVNRAAEAMTIFAVMCAGQFPIFHMGRVWDAMWVLPLPNSRGPLWPNFNSALLWDVFAISTYFTVSLLFWYSGLIPDFATIRDRAKTKLRKRLYGLASFGWTGTAKNWQRQEALALVLAGLSTPLVLSVHTIVSFDFATSVIPGWHTTIFPPYFVAGAIFSGFAMVNTLLVVTRKILGLEDYITVGHLEAMNKVIVLTGSIVGVAYLTELFMAWYSGVLYEQEAFKWRIMGPYWWSYWAMMTCNVVSPQLFWFKKLRRNIPFTFIMSIVVNIGMWFERFVIIVTSLYRDYIPGSWTYYSPTWPEVGFYLGTFGLFFTCYFLFAKYFPVIAVAEIKFVLKTSGESYKQKMNVIEEKSLEDFVHEQAHAH
ncbi:MAG: polysulfide reductase NrfD [Flavipsychrobacter sp.]|nr:polysulfide reductase NrfD [Flavipsychrobacter sp.]